MNIASASLMDIGSVLTVVELYLKAVSVDGRIVLAVEQRTVKHNLTGIHCINL